MESDKLDWSKVSCPYPSCGEIRKNTKSNKIFFDSNLSDRAKGKMCFFCTNHEPFPIHFVIQVFKVKDVVYSVREYVFKQRIPKTKTD